MPDRLDERVRPHVNLRFDAFYNLIHNNLALVPTLASEAYFDRKFSSTVITSLVTGVPVIVTSRFLKSYSFLSPDTVFLQWNSEPAMDAALRVLQLSNADLLAIRRNVSRLREDLNGMAGRRLEGIIQAAMAKPDAGTLPPL